MFNYHLRWRSIFVSILFLFFFDQNILTKHNPLFCLLIVSIILVSSYLILCASQSNLLLRSDRFDMIAFWTSVDAHKIDGWSNIAFTHTHTQTLKDYFLKRYKFFKMWKSNFVSSLHLFYVILVGSGSIAFGRCVTHCPANTIVTKLLKNWFFFLDSILSNCSFRHLPFNVSYSFTS